jgi:hypothetical protein
MLPSFTRCAKVAEDGILMLYGRRTGFGSPGTPRIASPLVVKLEMVTVPAWARLVEHIQYVTVCDAMEGLSSAGGYLIKVALQL